MMLSKKLDESSIKKILIISLSNLGDVILTFPVIDILKKNFPSALLSVVVGPKGTPLVKDNPNLNNTYVFDKHGSIKYKVSWILQLRKERFDLVVDLRNTAIPILISPQYRTPLSAKKFKDIHMKTKHLKRLKSIFDFTSESKEHHALYIPETDKQYIDEKLKGQIEPDQRFAVISPGAADSKKRWTEDGFAEVSDKLVDVHGLKIIFVGDKEDTEVAKNIIKKMKHSPLNLCGQTSLIQLAEVLSRAFFVIANDSAVMHLASYLDMPTLAIFGPTDSKKYGPWSSRCYVTKKDIFCPACHGIKRPEGHICMKAITPDSILNTIKVLPEGVMFIKP